MEDKRRISTEQGKQLADEYGVKFMETSAMNRTNVEQAFTEIATDIKKKMDAKVGCLGGMLGRERARLLFVLSTPLTSVLGYWRGAALGVYSEKACTMLWFCGSVVTIHCLSRVTYSRVFSKRLTFACVHCCRTCPHRVAAAAAVAGVGAQSVLPSQTTRRSRGGNAR